MDPSYGPYQIFELNNFSDLSTISSDSDDYDDDSDQSFGIDDIFQFVSSWFKFSWNSRGYEEPISCCQSCNESINLHFQDHQNLFIIK